jgi:hypothetical protein
VKKLMDLSLVFAYLSEFLFIKKFSTSEYMFSQYYLIFTNGITFWPKNMEVHILSILNFFPPALHILICTEISTSNKLKLYLTLSAIETGMNIYVQRRSQWLCSLRRRNAAALLVGFRVRNVLMAWIWCSWFVFVVSDIVCGPCDGLITYPEEYYRVVCI